MMHVFLFRLLLLLPLLLLMMLHAMVQHRFSPSRLSPYARLPLSLPRFASCCCCCRCHCKPAFHLLSLDLVALACAHCYRGSAQAQLGSLYLRVLSLTVSRV